MQANSSNYYLRIKFIYFISFLTFGHNIFSQVPSIQWQKCFGGGTIDEGYSIMQLSDGGYVISGFTESNNGDVSGLHNSVSNYPDYWILRLDNSGAIKWQKCLGGSINDYANCIKQTIDGGFIIAGKSNSLDGDVTGNHNLDDCWIVKLDSIGNIKWEKSYGGTAVDEAVSIQQTKDRGYIFAANTLSNDGDVTGNHGNGDCWVVKLDSVGGIKWQKCFGSNGGESIFSIDKTTDNGYIFLGLSSVTINGDVTFNHGAQDYWLVKLDSLGNLKWQKSLGGSDKDWGAMVKQTTDKGYILNGYSFSIDGDVTGNSGVSCDYWIVKTDSVGNISWQKSAGGSMNDYGSSIQQSLDGGFLIGGFTDSNDGLVSGNHGGRDNWIIKLDPFGNFIWQQCFGGTGDDYARGLQLTSDGGAIMVGNTNSNDGDVSGNHGGDDYWVVKLDNVNGVREITKENHFVVYPNPTTENISVATSHTFPFQNSIVTIQNTLGETVKKLSFTKNINVSDLAEGCYFLQITLLNWVTYKTKFIKQ